MEKNMLSKFAAGLLATALIAGPAFAQTSNTGATSGSAPAATSTTTQNAPAKAAAPSAKATTAPTNTMSAPAATDTKQSTNPVKTEKHSQLHKKTVKHVASRSHVKSGKMHQARHVSSVKSHQVNTGTTAKRS
jgi:hypothetical protein